MTTQKYNKGDHIMIAEDLGSNMAHFTSGVEAIVIGTYAEQFGGNDIDSYTLHIKGKGRSSWYRESQLTLVAAGQMDLLEEWVNEEEEHRLKVSDLDWIFANGKDVLKKCDGASAQALYSAKGGGSLWGARGEGVDYYCNSIAIIQLAEPFLVSGDKQGFLDLKLN